VDRQDVAVDLDPAAAVRNAYEWFESNSGWAPPDPDTLAEWLADGVCRCPDDCLAEPGGWCQHGLASWLLVLADADDVARPSQPRPAVGLGLAVPHPSRLDPGRPDFAHIVGAHRRAMQLGEPGYTDPTSGLLVMTARYLWEQGRCCDQGCRHCPFLGGSCHPG
jgi:hypothetical protein